jgi:hypothetical protein
MSQDPSQVATVGHLGDDHADLWQRAERLCRAVAAQDLANLPLYIVPQSRLAELGFADDLHGVTCLSLDLFVREYLEDYRGRGPAMVINEDAIRQCSHPADFEYILLATVLHELAHILERPTHYAERTADVDPMRIKFDALTVAHATHEPWPIDVPAYEGHDHVFIRTCLHLAYRAEQAGVEICPNVFCAGRGYGLYLATSYQRALGDKIIGHQRQRERTALTGYQQLVAAVAPQTEPEVEEVERLLAESGKTVEDLQRDSERLMRRLGYKDVLERLPALHKERAQLDTQIAAADRVLEEAEAAHDEATRPLYDRRSEVDRAIREAQDAEAKLVTECEDAELRRELEDVDAELIRLSTDRHDLLDQASHLEKQALAEQDRAERQLDPGYARQYREKAAQIEKDAAARRRDAQRVEKSHDELAKRRDRLEKQMRQA